jgi:hypothetical protein
MLPRYCEYAFGITTIISRALPAAIVRSAISAMLAMPPLQVASVPP